MQSAPLRIPPAAQGPPRVPTTDPGNRGPRPRFGEPFTESLHPSHALNLSCCTHGTIVRGSHQPGNGAQPPTHLPFLLLHAPGFRPAAFMIIAAEMQHTMDQQRHELFFQRSASRLGLTLSRRQGDDHITQVGRLLDGSREVLRASRKAKANTSVLRSLCRNRRLSLRIRRSPTNERLISANGSPTSFRTVFANPRTRLRPTVTVRTCT